MKAREVAEAIRTLETSLPGDVEDALERCLRAEEGNSRRVMEAILENVRYAREKGIPICQDTGTLVFFAKCSARAAEAIREGVEIATVEVPLRANTVDPFTRENDGRNLGRGNPIIHLEWEGEKRRCGGGGGGGSSVEEGGGDAPTVISILAKGAGSENVSRSFMLDPDRGIEGVREGVIDTVRVAGAKPCPPIVIGVGVGGSLEWSAYLSKKALLRPLGRRAEDPTVARLEEDLLSRINALGIGPMGFGGKTTALGVSVEWAYCHTASLPVSVSIQCWALRRVTAEWGRDGFHIR